MKKVILSLLLLCGIAAAQDCVVNFSNKSAAGRVAILDNRGSRCLTFNLSYSASSASAVSIQIESAPDNNGAPGIWTLVAATPINGTNPLVSATDGSLSIKFYAAWVSVNLVTFTTTNNGVINGGLSGYKASVNLANIGSGGSATPGGISGDIQYNNAGSLGGETILPVINGGTGTANPTPVAGAGITLAGIWPNQTISATGGGLAGFAITRTSGTVLSTAAGNVNYGDTTYAVPLSTVTIGAGTETTIVYVYITTSGVLTYGSTSVNLTATGGAAIATSVSSYPLHTTKVGRWTMTAGAFDVAGLTDDRAILNLSKTFSGAGGVTVDDSGPNVTITGGGSSVSSVFSRTGTVVAQRTDYPLLTNSQYTPFGDSIATGTGASITANGFAYLLASTLTNGTNLMYAHGGDMAADLAYTRAFNYSTPLILGTPMQTLMIGTNEGFYKGVGTYENVYKANLAAAIQWLTIPVENKSLAQGTNCTVTAGTFAAENAITTNNSTVRASNTNASALSCTIVTTGGPVYLWYMQVDGDGGTFNASVDGGATTGYTTASTPVIATQNGITRGVNFVKYTGLTAGTHTVLVTVTSATGAGNNVHVYGLGTPASLSYFNGPRLFVAGVPYELADAASASTAAYNADALSVVNTAIADTLPVSFIDVRRYNKGTAAEMFDTLHPNDLGHRRIANAFLAGMQQSPAAAVANGIGATSAIGACNVANVGKIYYPTDFNPYTMMCDGANWNFKLHGGTVTPANDTSFAWFNQGTAAVTTPFPVNNIGAVSISTPNVAGFTPRIRAVTNAATSWTATAAFAVMGNDTASSPEMRAGIVGLSGADGATDYHIFADFIVNGFTNATTLMRPEIWQGLAPATASNVGAAAASYAGGSPIWLRLSTANSITFTLSNSTDQGMTWNVISSVAFGGVTTMNKIGWFVSGDNQTGTSRATLLHWNLQ